MNVFTTKQIITPFLYNKTNNNSQDNNTLASEIVLEPNKRNPHNTTQINESTETSETNLL